MRQAIWEINQQKNLNENLITEINKQKNVNENLIKEINEQKNVNENLNSKLEILQQLYAQVCDIADCSQEDAKTLCPDHCFQGS